MPHSLSACTARIAVLTRLCVLLAGLLAGFALTACGNRGPLYLPDQDAAATAGQAAGQADEDEEEDDRVPHDTESSESGWP